MTRQPTPGVHENFADKQSPGNRTITGRTAREGACDPLPPITNLAADDDCFTVVFRGNLRKLQGNPHHYETQFGQVVSIGAGNAFEEAPEQQEPVAWLRNGENVPVRQVPLGAMWISDENDPRAFPVFAAPPAPESHVVGNDFEALAKQIGEAERPASGGPWCDGHEPIENRDYFAKMVRNFAENLPARQTHLRGALLPPQINMAVDGNAVTLAECPPGPFLFEGSLGFKTEYGAMSGKDVGNGKVEWAVIGGPDVYCMDSGDAFWGGVTSREARSALLVQPVDLYFADTTVPPAGVLESDPVTLRGYCQQLLDMFENYGVEIEGEDNDLIAHISRNVDPAYIEPSATEGERDV
jgi:hypothetical protein